MVGQEAAHTLSHCPVPEQPQVQSLIIMQLCSFSQRTVLLSDSWCSLLQLQGTVNLILHVWEQAVAAAAAASSADSKTFVDKRSLFEFILKSLNFNQTSNSVLSAEAPQVSRCDVLVSSANIFYCWVTLVYFG